MTSREERGKKISVKRAPWRQSHSKAQSARPKTKFGRNDVVARKGHECGQRIERERDLNSGSAERESNETAGGGPERESRKRGNGGRKETAPSTVVVLLTKFPIVLSLDPAELRKKTFHSKYKDKDE